MKFFTAIMAFIVLGLSCLPCTDSVLAMNAVKEKKEIIQQHQDDQDHDDDDDCSPFCQCTCCAGFSINHSFSSVNIPAITCCKNFASYLPENIIEISLPVWEPPRI